MKRTALALALIFALSFSGAIGAQRIDLAGANPNMFKRARYCNISIESPYNETTYILEPIFLNFTVKKVYVSGTYSFFYLLDGQDIQSGVKVEDMLLVGEETITNVTFFPYTEITLRGQAVLPILGNGPHNLTVFIGWLREDGVLFQANLDPVSTTAHFRVNTAAPTPFQSPSPQETEAGSKSFSTTWVAAGISVAAAVISLLLYFKKRDHKG